MFWPHIIGINYSSDLKNVANSRPSASNFESFSQSPQQFFPTVGQNNFSNKISITYVFLNTIWGTHFWRSILVHLCFSEYKFSFQIMLERISKSSFLAIFKLFEKFKKETSKNIRMCLFLSKITWKNCCVTMNLLWIRIDVIVPSIFLPRILLSKWTEKIVCCIFTTVFCFAQLYESGGLR